ncbi:MAG: glycosyltransferase family 2 protein [Candidatus Aenigmatarchaeota archaeon]
MMFLSDLINYAVWYVMIFFSMVWLLTFLKNRDNFSGNPGPPQSLPSVSAIVPAYNEEDVIEGTISSLLNLDYPKDKLEVIVVDDGSEDRTLEKARKFEPEIKVIEKDENRGKAHSLNVGTEIATGDFVVCLDADSFVESDTLKKMIGYFENDNVGIVTPALKVKNNEESFLSKIQHAEYLLNIFMRKIMTFLDTLPVAPGPFSIYRKEALENLGGFDEENITEDMEIALKFHDAGYKIENSSDGLVYTICPEKVKELYRQRLRWYRGVIYNTFKYKHMLFNPNYGNLGIFYLPLNLISVIMIMFLFGLIGYNVLNNFLSTFWNLQMVGFNILPFFKELNLIPSLDLFLFNFTTILFVSITIVGMGMLYVSFRKTDEKSLKNKAGFLSYLFIFPALLMLFWTSSIIHEVLGIKKRW